MVNTQGPNLNATSTDLSHGTSSAPTKRLKTTSLLKPPTKGLKNQFLARSMLARGGNAVMNREGVRRGAAGGRGARWAVLPRDWSPAAPSIIHKIVFESRVGPNSLTIQLNLIRIVSLLIS